MYFYQTKSFSYFISVLYEEVDCNMITMDPFVAMEKLMAMRDPLMLVSTDWFETCGLTEDDWHLMEHLASLYTTLKMSTYLDQPWGSCLLYYTIDHFESLVTDVKIDKLLEACLPKPCTAKDRVLEYIKNLVAMFRSGFPSTDEHIRLEKWLMPTLYFNEELELTASQVFNHLKGFPQQDDGAKLKNEIKKYMDLKVQPFGDVHGWWKENKSEYPILSSIVRHFLIFPGLLDLPSSGDLHLLDEKKICYEDILFLRHNAINFPIMLKDLK
jgi:hAT family C-terminal dimerisation region